MMIAQWVMIKLSSVINKLNCDSVLDSLSESYVVYKQLQKLFIKHINSKL